MIIELTDSLLFENISFLKHENISIDIHNDYDFRELLFEQTRMALLFVEEINHNKFIEFIFEDIGLTKFKITQFEVPDSVTIDNFYRGKVELNGVLIEQDSNNKKYFYLDFLEDIQIELWCSRLYLNIC